MNFKLNIAGKQMSIEVNRQYRSGLIADTELHAGGLFFCMVYQNCIEFTLDGKVTLTTNIVDAFRPMDDQDVKRLAQRNVEGVYYFNDRGYLVCDFNSLSKNFIGMPTEKDETVLAFYVFDRKQSSQSSAVYKLEKKSRNENSIAENNPLLTSCE